MKLRKLSSSRHWRSLTTHWESAHFDPLKDYPRKDLPRYFKQHQTEPAQALKLTYQLSDAEVAQLNNDLHTEIEAGFTFSISRFYDQKLLQPALPYRQRKSEDGY